ncbi:MAG: GFA family protein [Polyangiales bacterium]
MSKNFGPTISITVEASEAGFAGLGPGYGSTGDESFVVKYRARCHCGAVRYEVCADPVDAKICHCRACQVLHGAPMQWAAIFHKRDVRLAAGLEDLRFYNSELGGRGRALPCKVSCARCGTLIADEGRRMWLAFPTLFEFGTPPQVPAAFEPTCHIFYGARVIDIADGLPKWSGHKNESTLL